MTAAATTAPYPSWFSESDRAWLDTIRANRQPLTEEQKGFILGTLGTGSPAARRVEENGVLARATFTAPAPVGGAG